jgi:hypothetical protein
VTQTASDLLYGPLGNSIDFAGGRQSGFVYDHNGYRDLGALSDLDQRAESYSLEDINIRGEIVGTLRREGVSIGFIAKPVPEPSSLFALTGLTFFALLRGKERVGAS